MFRARGGDDAKLRVRGDGARRLWWWSRGRQRRRCARRPRAPDVDGADLRVELGDLRVDLTAAGSPVLTLGVHLILDLDLVPTAGALVPTVVRTTPSVTLRAELIDGDDDPGPGRRSHRRRC